MQNEKDKRGGTALAWLILLSAPTGLMLLAFYLLGWKFMAVSALACAWIAATAWAANRLSKSYLDFAQRKHTTSPRFGERRAE